MKYRFLLFPFGYAVVSGVLALSLSEEVDILFSIPYYFFATISLVLYVLVLPNMRSVEGQPVPRLLVKRVLLIITAAAFTFFTIFGFIYTFNYFQIVVSMFYVAMVGVVASTALVWKPIQDSNRRQRTAIYVLILTVIVLALLGIHAGNKFKTERDFLYDQQDNFKTPNDCNALTNSQLRSECLRFYSENTHGGVALCPEKIDATSMQCYAVKASREKSFDICDNKDFFKFYSRYPYEGWLESTRNQYGLANDATACKIELIINAVGKVDREYYSALPRAFLQTVLPGQVAEVCKSVAPLDTCVSAVTSALKIQFYLNEKEPIYTLDTLKRFGTWQLYYPSYLNQGGELKSFYEEQLIQHGPTGYDRLARYAKARASVQELFSVNVSGNSKVSVVVARTDGPDVLALVMDIGYGIDQNLERVARLPFTTISKASGVIEVYKYRSKPNYYAAIYKFTQGTNYLYVTSEDKELGYAIARFLTQ